MKSTHLILFMCMVLTLVGCQKQDSTPSPTDAATTAAAPIVEQSTAVAHSRLMNVPEHIHTTWTSNTGKTQIKVDADVQFGEVGLLPVFEVCPRLITKEEVTALADVLFAGESYQITERFASAKSMEEFGGDAVNGAETKQLPVAANTVKAFPAKSIRYWHWSLSSRSCQIEYEWLHDDDEIIFDIGSSVSALSMLTQPQADAFPLEDARVIADSVAAVFPGDMECVSSGFRTGHYPYDERSDEAIPFSDMFAYVFVYTRSYAGIQTTYTDEDCIAPVSETRDGFYIANVSYESLEIMVSPRGIEYVVYRTPHDTVQVLSEDSGLLPFEKILEVAESILPLRFASWEQYGAAQPAIDRIEFGYMRVRMRDEPNRFMMTPVWDFFGSEYRTEDEMITASRSLLTINAIDGTVIDRSYGY